MGSRENENQDGVKISINSAKVDAEDQQDCDKEDDIARPQIDSTVSKSTAIVLVLALGFHSLFEGIAFGLLSEIESAWQLAAGIGIHKTAAAISLGGAFAR